MNYTYVEHLVNPTIERFKERSRDGIVGSGSLRAQVIRYFATRGRDVAR